MDKQSTLGVMIERENKYGPSQPVGGSTMTVTLEATHLRDNRYAIRPFERLGTCGWLADGRAWQVAYVKARNASEAIRKAAGKVIKEG